ncbi:V-type proton ATPase subunit G-like isoform X1 [Harmonia axyridis]|uniref:V-type proton ATPase subunit G-like isoform X1 n=1 Tax=Harmonia axyridis TaxID=115357 RepID=UPI001E27887B|nr:V-type proton ATPase subunit G-like isoform X1 [Harmonia axyridis]
MASQTQGIQQLLVAEKRAAEKVGAARKHTPKEEESLGDESGKLKRIKQAREEANHDINAYRQERERQFRDFEVRHLGSKGDIAQKIDKETDGRLRQMADDVASNRTKVVDELINLVCEINPEIHRNFELLNYYSKI